jgi:hypothetical protein
VRTKQMKRILKMTLASSRMMAKKKKVGRVCF